MHLPVADAIPQAPTLQAKSWILIDYDSGRVLAEHDSDTPRAPGSLAKLMAAGILFSKLNTGAIRPDQPVAISAAAAAARGAKLFLHAGETVPFGTLLRGMIVHSANDATVALAEHAAGSEAAFVAEMNADARQLGLTHTHFANATGHDAVEQQTSARDLATLTAGLIRRFPDGYRGFAERDMEFRALRRYNRNALLWRDPSVDGVKTGHTRAAGYSIVASARRQPMRLIAVVLGGDDDNARFDGSRALLDFGFRHFETRVVYRARTPLTKTRVWLGETALVDLGPARDLYVTLPRGSGARLTTRFNPGSRVVAPVTVGQPAGTLVVELDGRRVGEAPLVALQAVAPGNALERALDHLYMLVQ